MRQRSDNIMMKGRKSRRPWLKPIPTPYDNVIPMWSNHKDKSRPRSTRGWIDDIHTTLDNLPL